MVLGEGPTQGLDDASIMTKAKYINFSRSQAKFCLGLHYRMESTVFYLLMLSKYISLKKKLWKKNSHCIYEILQRFFTQHDKAGWNGMVCSFSVHYRTFNIAVLPIFINI